MIAIALACVALLYAAVGHGGASGYLAVMALAGVEPATMKPVALVLNLTVSGVGTILFFRAGHFAWRLFWPFAVVSVPFAFLGGALHLSPGAFRLLVAAALAFAALRLVLPVKPEGPAVTRPAWWAVFVSGSLIGLVSGLIGVGGGIFLTPLLLLCGWARPKEAAAVSAPFIFVNSAAGLLGNLGSLALLPAALPWWLLAALAGGIVGARWGSRVALPAQLRPTLAAVLSVAVLKLLVT